MKRFIILILFYLTSFLVFAQNKLTNKHEVDSITKWALNEFKKRAYDNSCELIELNNCFNKTIYFLGVHHIGTQKYFNNIKSKVDSMHNRGYTVFWEGIYSDTTIGFIQRRKYGKKFSLILGDKRTPHERYSSFAKKFDGLVAQPSAYKLGFKESDSIADVSLKMMVEYFESRYGVININEGIKNDQLDMKKIRDEIILNYRNKYLISLLKNSKCKKILIVYGDDHKLGLKKKLNLTCK